MLLTGKSNVHVMKAVSVPFCQIQIAQIVQSNLGVRCEQLSAEHLSNGVLYFSFNTYYVNYLKCALQTDLLSLIPNCY